MINDRMKTCGSILADHPFEPFIPKGAKTLVIGTFPTRSENFQFPFYYSAKDRDSASDGKCLWTQV